MPYYTLSIICVFESGVERSRQELLRTGNEYDSGALVFTGVRFCCLAMSEGILGVGTRKAAECLTDRTAATKKNLAQMSVMLSPRGLAMDAEASGEIARSPV